MTTQAINVSTEEPVQLIDITNQVQNYVQEKSLKQGFLNIISQHTTATICLNESCQALEKDLKKFLKLLADPQADYDHNKFATDGRQNAHSHMLSYLMGATPTIPVIDGKLNLGKWQKIFFVELDGPRNRREFVVSFLGDTNGIAR